MVQSFEWQIWRHTVSNRNAVKSNRFVALAAASGLEMLTRDHLREFDHEGSSYVPTEVLKATDPEAYRERIASGFLDEGFDAAQFRADVVAEVDRIVADHRGQRVTVVCHGGMINAYLGHCLDFPWDDYMRFDVDYSSVSRVMVSSKLQRSWRWIPLSSSTISSFCFVWLIRRHTPSVCSSGSAFSKAGSVMRNIVPLPGRLKTSSRPPRS